MVTEFTALADHLWVMFLTLPLTTQWAVTILLILGVMVHRRTDRLSRRPSSRGVPTQTGVGRQFSMLTHPTRKGGWGDLVAVAGFQFGCGLGKGIAEIIERDAVKNNP